MGFGVGRRTYNILNEMLDSAISGEFDESEYNESEMSKLEVKWKRFLEASALSRQNIELERAKIKELVSDISHQVKTPIANIKLYGELMQEKLPTEDRELSERLLSQTELLESLIQSLVKMSRLETNIIQVNPEIQPIAPMLEEVMDRGLRWQEKKHVYIEKEEWPPDCQACFDSKWTVEAVYNILDNALKYTEEGSTVTVSVKEFSMFTAIAVKDQGPGIPEAEIPRIFQRFYRGQAVLGQEGVGLGLYLAREILKKESAYIKVTPLPDKGTIVAVYLSKEKLVN